MLARGIKPSQITAEIGCSLRVIYNWVPVIVNIVGTLEFKQPVFLAQDSGPLCPPIASFLCCATSVPDV
ncbi:hypothetical protein XNC1_4293 [Xenorhabdus nematophila ATCC 19061]|uniref:Uncharacterized protein n=3 Tax=Xenorhabdus nematophila TaxID=628 RepID=D3VE64_XENNA|nr:hypothetical protein XNC1_4293 [Xenorhabdus nematophila ATCC 19061]